MHACKQLQQQRPNRDEPMARALAQPRPGRAHPFEQTYVVRVTHGKSVWHSGRRRLAALLLAISWLSGLPSLAQYVPDTAPNQPAEARTETDGKERLSLSGGFVAPQITLDLPPGRRGMTPSLGLAYSPGTVNGILGAGWNLTFGSRIDRMSTNRGVDAVDASAKSRYFVDGVELVETFNGTFRRLQTDFTVFRTITNHSGKHVGWTAKKAGVTSLYGHQVLTVAGDERNAVQYADESVSSSGLASPKSADKEGQDGWGRFLSPRNSPVRVKTG